MLNRLFVPIFALSLVAAGCSDDDANNDDGGTTTEICDNLRDDDGNGQVDCYDSACATAPHCVPSGDGGNTTPDTTPVPDSLPVDSAPPTPDTVPHDTAPPALTSLQAVMDSMDLPTSGTEYAGDVDGDGDNENQIGVLGGVLSAAGVSLQLALNSSIFSGEMILLFDLHEDAARAGGFELAGHIGEDQDANPSDNFSGNEPFDIAANSPSDALLAASLDGGNLSADGKLVVGLPFGANLALMTLKKAHVEAVVTSSGMQSGRIYGALPMDEVNTKLIGGFAEVLNEPTISPTIFAIFDVSPTDGVVTAEELRNHFLITSLLVPDIDTDGDNQPDAMSFGAAFTAVSCTITP